LNRSVKPSAKFYVFKAFTMGEGFDGLTEVVAESNLFRSVLNKMRV